eukprot:GILJ01013463.1.p1 GENE.GILJ01013463.1~~GILJ01013463.1.p1  ORF type:complete len:849 (+),score=158.54 GILJ01013463.1:341-2548(+)
MGTDDSQPRTEQMSNRHRAQINHASSLCVDIVTAVLFVFSPNHSSGGTEIGSHTGSTPSDILVSHLTDAIKLFCSVPTNEPDVQAMAGSHETVSLFHLRAVSNNLPTVVIRKLSEIESQLNQLRSAVGSHVSSRDNCLQWKLPSSRDFQDRVMNIVPGLTCFNIYDTQEPFDELTSAFKVRQGLPVAVSPLDAIRLGSYEEVDLEEHVDWKACQTLDRIVLTLFDATRPIRSIDEINKEKEAAARKAEAVDSKKAPASSSAVSSSQPNAFNRTQRRPVTSRPPAQHVDDYTAPPTAGPYPGAMHNAAPRPAGRGGKPGPSRAPSKHVDDFMANQKPAYPVIGTTAHTSHTPHPVQASPPVSAAVNTPSSASGPTNNRRDSSIAPHGHGSEPNYPHQTAASYLNQSGVGSGAASTSFMASHPSPAAASSQFGYDPTSPWPSQGYSQESTHPHRRAEPESTGAPHDPRFREHHLNQQPNPSAYVPEPMQVSHQYGVDSASPRITSAAPLGHPSQSSTVLPGVTMSTPLAGQAAVPAAGQVPFNPLLSLNLALNQTLGQRGVGLTNPLEAIQALTAMSGGQLPANLLSSVQLLTGLQQKGAFTLPQQPQQQQQVLPQPQMHTTPPSLIPQQQSPHPMYHQPSLQLPVHPTQTGRPQTGYASASPLATGTPTAAPTGTATGSMSPALLAAVLNPNASLSSQDIQQIVADPRSLQDPRIKQKLAKFLSQNPDLLNKIMKK